MKRLVLYISVLSVTFGCSAELPKHMPAKIFSATDVAKDPVGFDGQEIHVKGYMVADLMNRPFFYLSRSDADRQLEYESIDIVSGSEAVRSRLRNIQKVTCVVVDGRFEAYIHDKVMVGTFSKYGALTVNDFEVCGE